jgi:molybdopterin adenylyltransferase
VSGPDQAVTLPAEPPRVAVVTVSDSVAAGTRRDASGAAIVGWVRDRGYTLVEHTAVPDTVERITAALRRLADSGDADVIITTGGTGLTRRDVTPEATSAVIERAAPGIAERIRQVGAEATAYAALSRGVAGVRGDVLIVNLPGSAGGVGDGLGVLAKLVDHAVQLLRGIDTDRHDPADG